ncbi:hypothetical protein [Dysgonomonas termitidis]|uniref:Uncharacterized protein n=1 Tax=Dysgonomonas termitidis TaxID=1516126 RepID=A0ABV9KYD2_9BACT
MENHPAEKNTSSVQMRVLEGYKECLKTTPHLSFKSYCEDNNINYERLLDWAQRHGIFIRELQAEARCEDFVNGDNPQTFIQFRPQSHPVMAGSVLKGISITFPNNVNLTLQECTAESLISLLSLYHPEK